MGEEPTKSKTQAPIPYSPSHLLPCRCPEVSLPRTGPLHLWLLLRLPFPLSHHRPPLRPAGLTVLHTPFCGGLAPVQQVTFLLCSPLENDLVSDTILSLQDPEQCCTLVMNLPMVLRDREQKLPSSDLFQRLGPKVHSQ